MPVMNTESIFPSGLSAAFGGGLTGGLAERARYRWDTCIEVRTSVTLGLFPVNSVGFLSCQSPQTGRFSFRWAWNGDSKTHAYRQKNTFVSSPGLAEKCGDLLPLRKSDSKSPADWEANTDRIFVRLGFCLYELFRDTRSCLNDTNGISNILRMASHPIPIEKKRYRQQPSQISSWHLIRLLGYQFTGCR